MNANTTQPKELIKVVNYGKNGIYLYSAIVKIGNTYFWTKSVLLKNKNDKHSFDFLNTEIQRELNEWSLNKYINN